ncbi:ATP-dependent RNA helicase [Angomonas deanei]|nr:ATP-dependent RNA helicase [Angomonas deanei]|eukprot:EPY24587.1 ATP-dependent RNA helicase [Angomonas deanei]
MSGNHHYRKKGPKVKRATDAEHVDPPRTSQKTDESNWNAEEGGNVVQWLAQKTSTAERSRGAVDYLNKKNKKKADAKPDSKGDGDKSGAQEIPKPRSAANKDQKEGKNVAEELNKIMARNKKEEEAAEGENKWKKEGEQGRRTRGKRTEGRRNHREDGEKKRQAYEEEARKRHEEAMRTDPEYQKTFETMKERQEAMQVSYQRFSGEYAHQQNVIVDSFVRERLDIPLILDLVDQHDVVFVCTDTGSGKSTTIPKALLELSTETRVVSTQPRRTATVSIATRVAQSRRENVGEDVGYWIRGEKKGDDQTRLWYMTSYTLLLQLLEDPAEIPYTHIILDEFHEQQPDIEVMVALLRLSLLKGRGKFKLILMSATLNTSDWEQYFEGLKVATYKQSEPEHPIHDYFMEDVCTLLGSDYVAPPALCEKGFVEKKLVTNHMYIAEHLIAYINGNSYPHHSILVFLPGRAQVEEMQLTLERHLRSRVDVIPWHSAVDLTEIEAAMRRQIPGRQKVYLATDIAEVSITLPDVVFVIDLVLVKRPKITKEIPASLLYPPLVTQWISKGSIAQRRGRVGRVQQGFYFCLFPAAQIPTLQDHAQAPIENSRIDELSLHCLQIVANPVAVFSICHSQPLAETIASSMNTLTELGCIIDKKDPFSANELCTDFDKARTNNWGKEILTTAEEEASTDIEEFQCTFIGRILQLIPASPQPGMLVFYGLLTGLESLMILASAVTSSLSPFSTGNASRNLARAMEETENVMRDMCCGLRSDIVSVMKAVLLFRVGAGETRGE